MAALSEQRPERKHPREIDIDLHERATQLVAQRFALSFAVASVVVNLSGLGGGSRG